MDNNNSQKTPLGKTLNVFAARKAQDAIELTGKALPCSVVSVSGAIVTVKFEVQSSFTLPNVTMPLFGPEYIRYPIQKGDKGFTIPADTYLGGVSDLGGGTATLAQRGNLSTLVFLPIGSKKWTPVDPNAVTIYGPNGVVLRDTNSKSTIIILPAGIAITGQNYVNIICGQCSIKMTPSQMTITDTVAVTSPKIMNNAWNQLVAWLNSHSHPDAQGGTTGAPITPFSGSNVAP